MEKWKGISLSISHITEDDDIHLKGASKDSQLVLDKQYGYLIHINTDWEACSATIPDDFSKYLKRVIELAIHEKARWVEFDSDVEPTPFLETFDW